MSLLTLNDCCDTRDCNAKAWVRVHLLAGDLDFCAHHARELKVRDLAGAYITDESHQLVGAVIDAKKEGVS